MRESIVTAVQTLLQQRNDLRILVTGHSMGGAMASFCALDLTANYGVKNIQVFTFGQPRIGNPAFAAYYSENVPLTIRVTHSHDVVPHLPPYYLIMGEKTYRHFATEVVCCTMSFAYPYEGLALNVCHVPLSILPASSFGFLIFLSPSFLSLFLGSYFLHRLFAILLLFYAC
jgi:hypothetical protein